MQPTRVLSQQACLRVAPFCSIHIATGLRRVNPTRSSDNASISAHRKSTESRSILSQHRTYATATITTTVKTPGKPKAHTGRTTATKRKPASTIKKPATPTTKPKAKPKAKSKAKPRAKAKPKAKPKPRRRVLTEKQKEAKAKVAASQKIKDLRAKALLTAPKGLPSTAWQVLQNESSKGKTGVNVGVVAKEASATYKSLTPEERERLNHIANENKAKNEAAYKQWLSSFTAKQVKEANTARTALRRESKKNGGHKQYAHLQDARLVKQALSPYTYFFKERNDSGDMKGMKIGEIGGLVGKEWKALSAGEKKVGLIRTPVACHMIANNVSRHTETCLRLIRSVTLSNIRPYMVRTPL